LASEGLRHEQRNCCPEDGDTDCTIVGRRCPPGSAQDPDPVHYTCANGTQLQATFSPPSISLGSVKLVYHGSSSETTLPQTVSVDGGRYTQGDVEFWIKGKAATLTRAGKATTCRVSG
jgi:membrane-bound inhibitor of C-type lysozyme